MYARKLAPEEANSHAGNWVIEPGEDPLAAALGILRAAMGHGLYADEVSGYWIHIKETDLPRLRQALEELRQ